MPESTHAYTFLAGTDTATVPLVLLHGTGGNESDLMSLADDVAPGATKICIRGTVAMEGGYAFFHRFPDRQVDEGDLAVRVAALAEFIEGSRVDHRLARRPVALGFSNGAIMAAALLFAYPELLAGAILFRPLSPFTHDPPCRLDRMPVLIIDGAKDGRRSAGDGLRLAERLRRAGALVTHHVLPVGHSITADDGGLAREWLRALNPA